MGAQIGVAPVRAGKLRIAITGPNLVHADSPAFDAEPRPPILHCENEYLAVAADAPVRLRLGAERERRRHARTQREARARLDPSSLLRRRRVPLHVERRDRIGAVEPAVARVDDRVGVGDVRLESSTGVPSSMSMSCTCSVSPSMRSSRTADKPIGFGRCGERVANTPLRPDVLRGGSTFGRQPALWWNQNSTQMWSQPSRSSSACS